MRNLFLRWLIVLKLYDIAQLACIQAPTAPTTAVKGTEYAAPLKITLSGATPYAVWIETPEEKKNERVTIEINEGYNTKLMQAEFSLIKGEPCVKLNEVKSKGVKISHSTEVQEDPEPMEYKDTKKTCPSVKR